MEASECGRPQPLPVKTSAGDPGKEQHHCRPGLCMRLCWPGEEVRAGWEALRDECLRRMLDCQAKACHLSRKTPHDGADFLGDLVMKNRFSDHEALWWYVSDQDTFQRKMPGLCDYNDLQNKLRETIVSYQYLRWLGKRVLSPVPFSQFSAKKWPLFWKHVCKLLIWNTDYNLL